MNYQLFTFKTNTRNVVCILTGFNGIPQTEPNSFISSIKTSAIPIRTSRNDVRYCFLLWGLKGTFESKCSFMFGNITHTESVTKSVTLTCVWYRGHVFADVIQSLNLDSSINSHFLFLKSQHKLQPAGDDKPDLFETHDRTKCIHVTFDRNILQGFWVPTSLL